MHSAKNFPQLLHIVPFAAYGGTEKDCLHFIKASHEEYQHKVWVLDGLGPMVEQWTAAGAEVQVLNILQRSQSEVIDRLSQLSHKHNFDGILYWSTIKLPAIRYALRNQRCRMAVHVGNPANFRIAVMLKQMVEHVFYASTIDTCLFACSNHVLKSLKVHPYYRQFKATVSYNPVQLLEHNPYQLRKISAASEVIIGMTARLDPIKDHRTLLLAFKNVLNHYPLARLWLIGDGVLKNELELLALQINIAQQVTFWGNVADVYEKLMQMDIFVYSTTPREGLGNAVSEAMACGLPCIVSDLPMMHELVGTPPSALLFEPSDVSDLTTKLLQLLTDEQLRNNLSKQAFQRAISNFNASRYVTERMRFIFNSNN